MTFSTDLAQISSKYQVKMLSTSDLAKYLGKDVSTVQRLVHYHKIPVLKNGMYLLDSKNTTDFEIAFGLDPYSYISLDTALYTYGLIPEVVRPVYCVTTKETKQFTNIRGNYIYKHIKESLFFGYQFHESFSMRMAQKEKAMLDYFYYSSLRVTQNMMNSCDQNNFQTKALKSIIEWFQAERFQNLHTLDFDLLKEYGKKMNKKVMFLSVMLKYYFQSDEYENYL